MLHFRGKEICINTACGGGEKPKFLAEMLVFFHSPLGVENQDVSDSNDVNVGGSDFNVRRNSEFCVSFSCKEVVGGSVLWQTSV